EELMRSELYYAWKGRYALAVERLAHGKEHAAEKLLRAILESEKAPGDVRNDARLALARLLYEQKKHGEAFELYSKMDSPLPAQDVVLLEKAWTKVADRDQTRALGMVVGLGAPVYGRLFAPERALIRGVALNRLCQFRAAHLVVLDFRRIYKDALARIRERRPLADDATLKRAALGREELQPARRWREHLVSEQERLGDISDRALRAYLEGIYKTKRAAADQVFQRALGRTLAKVAEELLRVDEQM